MTNTVKYVVYTQNNKLGKTVEFDNAKDVIKWAKENVYVSIMSKRKKIHGKSCLKSFSCGLGKEKLSMLDNDFKIAHTLV